MGATGLGLLVEERRSEIAAAWRDSVRAELGVTEPSLGFAVAPLLREMGLALGGQGDDLRSRDAWARCAVLVRSTAASAQLAREFKLLHRSIWEALRAGGAPVAPDDRRSADEWLDEALAHALDRLERVRLRVAALEPVGGFRRAGDEEARRRGAAPAGRAEGRTALPQVAATRTAAPASRPMPPPLPRSRPVPPPLRRAAADDQVEPELVHR